MNLGKWKGYSIENHWKTKFSNTSEKVAVNLLKIVIIFILEILAVRKLFPKLIVHLNLKTITVLAIIFIPLNIFVPYLLKKMIKK